MESQLPRSHGHPLDESPQKAGGLHSEVEGDDEHTHEKKSVLNKVKAKAKKIKDSFAKHGHGHDHDHDHDEEEEGEDEEMEEDPEVHGAPIYDSASIRSGVRGVAGRQTDSEKSDQTRTHLERTEPMKEAHMPEDKDKNVSFPSSTFESTKLVCDTGYIRARGEQEKLGQPEVRIGKQTGMEVDPQAPKDQSSEFVPSNYQTKVNDPTGTGGEEIGITSILSSLNKMNVYDEPKHTQKSGVEQKTYTGSHDQFSTEPIPDTTNPPNPESFSEIFDPSNPKGMPRDTLTGQPSKKSSSYYTGAISSATFAIANKAASATNVVASKLGYGVKESTGSYKMPGEGNAGKTASPTDMQSSSYTGAISSATSAIADKAASAKNVVASKLGYGGNEDSVSHEVKQEGNGTKSASPTDYAHTIAATVTDKLLPVYGKVAGAGSAVMSKVPRVGTGTGSLQEGEDNKGHDKDKGVSVKAYLVEKLRPGDEDRALSEVITGALQKRKEEAANPVGHKATSEVTSDASHKTSEEPGFPGEGKPLGKVTESEEVARQLGTGIEDSREGDDADKFGVERGTVGWIKGTVNSWLGRGSESQASQEAKMSGEGAHEQDQGLTEERRLQSN